MRRKAAWLAGVAVVAACLLPGPAGAADTTLVADPVHGPPGQPFTLTYTYHGHRCWGGNATFMWNFAQIGSQRLDGGCAAQMTITPPAGDAAPGPHSVQVFSMSGFATTTYTIDPPPAPASSPPVDFGTPSSGPPLPPSPPPPSSASPSPTPTRVRHTRTPSASPSVAPTPSSPPATVAPAVPCRPDTPSDGGAATLAGSVFAAPVEVRALDPSRVRPLAVDLSGRPQIRLTVVALPDPTPVIAAVGDGSPQPCLRLALGPGDGYDWAAYAFRDVVLTGYQRAAAAATAILSFSYGGVAWRYARTGGEIVSGDTTSPALPVGSAPFGWLMPGFGLILVFTGAGAWWWLRRTRHVGTRRAPGLAR